MFGIVVFEGAEELDFVGPWELVGMWHQVHGGPRPVLVGERVATLRCAKGLQVVPHHGFADCPPLNHVLVPGGRGVRSELGNAAMAGFLAERAPQCESVLSVCTGSLLLHAAGLLAGRRATTHWTSLEKLRQMGGVDVVEERFVRDGDVWTSAGVSAGIDMLLAFIASTAGEAVAGAVQLDVEYFPDGCTYGGIERDPRAPRYVRDAGSAPGR